MGGTGRNVGHIGLYSSDWHTILGILLVVSAGDDLLSDSADSRVDYRLDMFECRHVFQRGCTFECLWHCRCNHVGVELNWFMRPLAAGTQLTTVVAHLEIILFRDPNRNNC